MECAAQSQSEISLDIQKNVDHLMQKQANPYSALRQKGANKRV